MDLEKRKVRPIEVSLAMSVLCAVIEVFGSLTAQMPAGSVGPGTTQTMEFSFIFSVFVSPRSASASASLLATASLVFDFRLLLYLSEVG